jgi:myo-inositol-1(or 4)-monophosphatase
MNRMEKHALAVAEQAARSVGALLRGAHAAAKHARAKSHRHDPVTVFDRMAEDIVVEAIRSAFPADGILSEEGASVKGASGYRWIVDPLDGTNNFLRGYPHFCTSIGVWQGDEPRIACVYDPLRDELFTACAGAGARINGERVGVSAQPTLDGAVIGVGLSSLPQRALHTHDTARRLIPVARSLRTSGSACLDLAYVACARLDVSWFASLSAWDVAAGILLVREAGGRATDLVGEPLVDPQTGILATNGLLHEQVIGIIGRDRARDL